MGMGYDDYEKLWFEVCEEKKRLQIENHRLKKDSEHWRKRAEELERLLDEKNNKI